MEKNRFVQLVADMLYRTDRESLNLETLYKSLEEWNYLFEVSLAMMLEEEYQVEVTPEDCGRGGFDGASIASYVCGTKSQRERDS